MQERKAPVALVTGASRGIGRGIAVSLAADGYSVAICYAGNRSAALETETACRERAPGGKGTQADFQVFQVDVSRESDRVRLLSEVKTAFGAIDLLVNNAGMAPRVRADVVEASEESFEELMRVNLQGPYFLTQAVVADWLRSGEKSLIPSGYKVVFISSISADTVSVNRGEYCVSKAGLAMAAQVWAARLAPEGIQVFDVRPGITATDMTSGVKEKYDRLISEGLVPQMRWGEPEDTGRVVAALARGDLGFSTGAVIYTDGGLHIPRL